MSDYAKAVWIPSPHMWAGTNHPRYVIIHGTGFALSQTAASVAHDFQTTNPNSTHYAVGRAGDVAQMVAEQDAAWGNGVITPGADPWWQPNPNTYTISIEHVNDSQNGTPLTLEQKAASFALIKDICQRRTIPMRPADATGGITGHYSMDPVNRAHCPGNYPWAELWAYLGVTTPTAQPGTLGLSSGTEYFTQDSPDGWTCKKNGNRIVLGILTFYRSVVGTGTLNGLTLLGLPLTNEFYPVAGVSAQVFERGVVVWDPERKLDNPPGATGQCYLGRLDDPRLNPLPHAGTGAAGLPADLRSTLAALGQVLAPSAQVADQLARVRKELGY